MKPRQSISPHRPTISKPSRLRNTRIQQPTTAKTPAIGDVSHSEKDRVNQEVSASTNDNTGKNENLVVGAGRHRVLICVDEEANVPIFPTQSADTTDTSFFLDLQAPSNPQSSPMSSSVVDGETNKPKDLVLLGPVYRNGRKLSKSEVKFDYLSRSLPQYKIDKKMQTTIVETMKNLDCWSSDEESVVKPSKSMESPTISRKGSLRVKAMTSMVDSDDDSNSSIGSDGGNMLRFPSPANAPRRDQFGRSARVRDISAPANPREKAELKRPNQILESSRLRNQRVLKAHERESSRAVVIEKAVEVLVDLRQQRLASEQSFMKSIMKEVTQGKKSVASRVAFGLVDRALRKTKAAFIEKWQKKRKREEIILKKKTKAAKIIASAYRRYRFRNIAYVIRKYGREHKLAEFQREQDELYAFRWRCGQRMIEESRHLKMQPLQLKSKRRHTPQSSPRRSISPRSHRTSQYSPRASLTLNQEEEEDLTENNEEEEAVAASDERLFSVDYEHTRPDLAPFSTMIHNMIQHVARQHHHVVTTESDLLTSIRDRHRDDEVHDEPLSSRTLYSPRIDLLRSAMTTPGPAEQQNISISASPSRPQSRAEQWSEFQDRMISTASSTSSRRMKSRIEMDSHVPVNIETVGHLWEEMAQVNTSIAETKALLKDNGSTGGGSSGRRKSSAYLALEKLCGLKEEDIQRQNERFKSKRHHVNNSFLNSNLLR